MRFLISIVFLVCSANVFASLPVKNAKDNKVFWEEVKRKLPEYKRVFKKYKKFRFEVIYTRIDRNEAQEPTLTSYHFGDTASYFYPASVVKMPIAVFAIEKIDALKDAFISSQILFD